MTDDERRGSARGRGGKPAEEYEWSAEPHLTAISEEEFRARQEKLSEEGWAIGWAIGYARRVVRGRIDLIRAELVRRGDVTLPPEGLARVLLGEGRQGGGAS
jgi:hypothetical protein